MNRKFAVMLVIGLCAAGIAMAQAGPLDVLKSNASHEEKMEACRVLSVHAGVDAVPVLKPLLLDEKLSHPARYVLEPMQHPEAGEALRDALGKTTGVLKVGIISSLEVRRDTQAVPALIPLLDDADAQVAQAAARALGRIATPEAVRALEDAVDKTDAQSENMLSFCDALFDCAEIFFAKGQRQDAVALYDKMLNMPNAPVLVRAASISSGAVARGADGISLIVDALNEKDDALFAAGLRAAREAGGVKEVAVGVAGALAKLGVERKVQVIDVLGRLKNPETGPALLEEAKGGPTAVRVAAINSLTHIAYTPALDVMKQMAFAEDADVARAAKDSISYFPGGAGDDIVKDMLRDKEVGVRMAAVEMVSGGALQEPLEFLLNAAESDADEGVRVAALKGLKDYVTSKEMPRLLDRMLKASSQAEIQAAENTLEVFCKRQTQVGPQNVSIQKAVYGNLPDGAQADVTDKVVAMVESGRLAVDASNANFGDAAPGVVKKLKIDYTQNGVAACTTVSEGETVQLSAASVPAAVVDAFCASMQQAQGDARLAMLQLLRAAGTTKTLDAVRAAASEEGAVKDMALRMLCEWPSAEALPEVMALVKAAQDQTVKMLALRSAVRMLAMKPATPDVMAQYFAIMENAANADEKKAVLGSLARVQHVGALELAMRQIADESVKAEAVQAAISVATALGKSAWEDGSVFNGKDLTGWTCDPKYWRFEDGAIVGQSDGKLETNNFAWSGVEVGDFYLAIDIKLEPPTGNGGVQFRSKKFDESGSAIGYQFDLGKDVWGRLYHERGRGKIDWTDRAEKAVKPGEWNHCEILAVGPAIWSSVNGQLGIACLDPNGERTGLLAFQLHVGPPETVQYRIKKLVHNPPIQMEGMTAEMLLKELKTPTGE